MLRTHLACQFLEVRVVMRVMISMCLVHPPSVPTNLGVFAAKINEFNAPVSHRAQLTLSVW